jgi:putative lipoic acid-binding regulatory protein
MPSRPTPTDPATAATLFSADAMATVPESLIEYPSQFPIKVMGARVDGFVHAVTMVAMQFDPGFDAATIELRESRGGKYLGVTITVTATSREQLDELYRTLSTHPMVKVVL